MKHLVFDNISGYLQDFTVHSIRNVETLKRTSHLHGDHLDTSYVIFVYAISSKLNRKSKAALNLFQCQNVTTTTTTTSNQTSCTFPCTCAGIASYTLWQAYSTYSMYMIIDTTNCNFNQAPLYFTSMAGLGSQYGLTSYGAIYSASSTSFTIYSQNLFNWTASTLLNMAATNAWNVNWF
ncbi:unnamed protein product, partial [Rotaria socialis]